MLCNASYSVAMSLSMQKTINQLRVVGFFEGVSFLVLLLVAMPLKYLAGMPLPVRITGAVHGFLFVLYIIAVARAARANQWSTWRVVDAVVASLYPLGTFVLDRKLRDEAWKSQDQVNSEQRSPAANEAS